MVAKLEAFAINCGCSDGEGASERKVAAGVMRIMHWVFRSCHYMPENITIEADACLARLERARTGA